MSDQLRITYWQEQDGWWINPVTGAAQAVPRHVEVSERLARAILKAMSAEPRRRAP